MHVQVVLGQFGIYTHHLFSDLQKVVDALLFLDDYASTPHGDDDFQTDWNR